ncbi:MAG: hypothetical protein FWC11_01395 [Firmicutes bacterium]|nr:hypothetical protein [Bacillota bacterium]
MKKAKILVLTFILALTMVFAIGCGGNIHFFAPMMDVEVERNITKVWDSDYDLVRLQPGNFVFQQNGTDAQAPITAEALVAGGAARATVYFRAGDEVQYGRFVAFAYEFFDHARPTTRLEPAQSTNIHVLWFNPSTQDWVCLIRNSIGSSVVNLSNDYLISRRTGNQQRVFRLDRENDHIFHHMELFIVAQCRPTREADFLRSGFVINFAFELPDFDNHFHGFNTLVSASRAIIFEGDCE